MYFDNQIIALIGKGKFIKALRTANSRPFTTRVLSCAADACYFGLLGALIQIAIRKEVHLGYFMQYEVLEEGRIDIIDYLFSQKGLDPNLPFESFGRTILMRACACNQRDIVELLLKNGADPEQIDSEGRNAFFYAAGCPDVNILRLLILHTGKVDYVDHEGKTLLHLMCSRFTEPYQEVFDEIIGLNVLNVNSQDQRGNTALHQIIEKVSCYLTKIKDPDFIDYRVSTLIKHPNIDLTVKNHEGKTVWDLCEEESSEVLELVRRIASKES